MLLWDVIDVVSFAWSLIEYIDCPTLENLGWLALDVVSLLPLIPSIGLIGKIDNVMGASKYASKIDDVIHMHHTVPREILTKFLPGKIADNPLVRGVKGAPNRWPIPAKIHLLLHKGAGGGLYNELWKQMIDEVIQAVGKIEVEDVVHIRNEIAEIFNITRFKP